MVVNFMLNNHKLMHFSVNISTNFCISFISKVLMCVATNLTCPGCGVNGERRLTDDLKDMAGCAADTQWN